MTPGESQLVKPHHNAYTDDEVLQIIEILPSKSFGPAIIPLRLFKVTEDLIVVPLGRIISLSFSTGVFPEVW